MNKNKTTPNSPRIIHIGFFVLSAFALLFVACEAPIYTPKPRIYPKVIYPERGYQTFETGTCPFRFEFPVYATIDNMQQENKPLQSPCWFDIYIQNFDVRIHCTYYPIKRQADFEQLWLDAFDLADKHNIKADFIDTQPIKKEMPQSDLLLTYRVLPLRLINFLSRTVPITFCAPRFISIPNRVWIPLPQFMPF
ncbi:MAG: hypothetical protein HC912_07980 [Saprospiraceae bacterium]|nr:hypothetical protein [Saprospiraceae bacterium]